MKNSIIIAMVAALLLSSCGATKSDVVDYSVAQRYFVNNNVDDNVAILKATSDDELDKYFGMATVMGEGGRPTAINFKKDFAIGVTLPESDGGTDIKPVSLKKTGNNELTLSYSVVVGHNHSYKVKPLTLLVVSKKYKDYDIKLKKE